MKYQKKHIKKGSKYKKHVFSFDYPFDCPLIGTYIIIYIYGNSEIGACVTLTYIWQWCVRSNLCCLICLRHLIGSKAVTN